MSTRTIDTPFLQETLREYEQATGATVPTAIHDWSVEFEASLRVIEAEPDITEEAKARRMAACRETFLGRLQALQAADEATAVKAFEQAEARLMAALQPPARVATDPYLTDTERHAQILDVLQTQARTAARHEDARTLITLAPLAADEELLVWAEDAALRGDAVSGAILLAIEAQLADRQRARGSVANPQETTETRTLAEALGRVRTWRAAVRAAHPTIAEQRAEIERQRHLARSRVTQLYAFVRDLHPLEAPTVKYQRRPPVVAQP